MSGGRIAQRLVISGRVQGVGYRDWTVATARGLGLDGWVRNRRDGGVEALVAGDAAAISALVVPLFLLHRKLAQHEIMLVRP